MANTSSKATGHPSPQKRARRDSKKRILNHARLHRISTFVKQARERIAKEPTSQEAHSAFRIAQAELMRGVRKGVLHINTASRRISRMASLLSL